LEVFILFWIRTMKVNIVLFAIYQSIKKA